jgi:hypothetical protein
VKVPFDVVLPQVSVLGSTMAYREAGNPDARSRFFRTRTRPRPTYGGISLRWLHHAHDRDTFYTFDSRGYTDYLLYEQRSESLASTL